MALAFKDTSTQRTPQSYSNYDSNVGDYLGGYAYDEAGNSLMDDPTNTGLSQYHYNVAGEDLFAKPELLTPGPDQANNPIIEDIMRLYELDAQRFRGPGQSQYFGPVKYPIYQSVAHGPSSGSGERYGMFGKPTLGDLPNLDSDRWTLEPGLMIEDTYDPQYFDELVSYARSTDESPWAQLMGQRLDVKYGDLRDQLEQSMAGSLAKGRENLAMRRGLRSGASERLESAGIGQRMQELQKLGRGRLADELDIALQERENKMGLLQRLPEFERQRAAQEADISQRNIANILGEREREFGAKMDAYKTQMAAWAAQQQASATERLANQNKGGLLSSLFDSINL